MIPLDFPLDALQQLTSEQLACVQFHPDGSDRVEMAAEKVFMKRRVRDLEGPSHAVRPISHVVAVRREMTPLVDAKPEAVEVIERLEDEDARPPLEIISSVISRPSTPLPLPLPLPILYQNQLFRLFHRRLKHFLPHCRPRFMFFTSLISLSSSFLLPFRSQRISQAA